MKKTFILLAVLCCLILPAFASEVAGAEKNAEGLIITERNIKILANALELYANDNFREYPSLALFSEAVYGKGKFADYLRKAIGKNTKDLKPFFTAPPAGMLKYTATPKKPDYTLSCPNPERYGLKALYFTPMKGLVKDGGKSTARPAPAAKKPEIKKSDLWKPAATADEQAMKDIIAELYTAYKNKDIAQVMGIQKESIRRAGIEMEKSGKYTAAEVEDAYRGTALDLFNAEGFQLEPLNVVGVKFENSGSSYRATSFIPIITSNKVHVATMMVRLKIGNIEFEKIDGKMIITRMQMY